MKKGIILSAFVFLSIVITSCKEDNGVTITLPKILSVSPSAVEAGEKGVLVRIVGTDFISVQSVSFGAGIAVRNMNVPDVSHIDVTVDISISADPGPRSVVVTAAQGSATLPNAIEVEEHNDKPRASFTVDPKTGNELTTFVFDATASSDPDGTIKSYHWDFGDGDTKKNDVVKHKFEKGGDYIVTLTVKDDRNLEDTLTKEVRVWDFAQSAKDIDDVCKQFLIRFGKIETLSAEEIVIGFSKAEGCKGREREIKIIENSKPNVGETNVDLIGNSVITELTETRANAHLTARFYGVHKDGSEFDGVVTHFFTMILEEDGWKICDFTAKNE